MKKINNGDVFGKLNILEEVDRYVYSNGQKQRQFKCKCDCGNIVIVRLISLLSGNTTSCGCSRRKYDKSLYGIRKLFTGIKQRCNNHKNVGYNLYGGRGIKCEWNTFDEFYNDMGSEYKKGLSIERIDVDGNYCKSNCIWIEKTEQANNRRNTIKYSGTSLRNYCKQNDVNYETVWNRYRRLGWTLEESLFGKQK